MIDPKAAVGAIARRFVQDPPEWKLPGWAPLLFLADFAVFMPILLFAGYTLATVFPTLAIVEDPNPPAYEPLAATEATGENQGEPAQYVQNSGKPVTSSLRATRKLVQGIAGWRSYFRGIVCAAALVAADSFISGIIGSPSPFRNIDDFSNPLSVIPIGSLITQLALTQLGCAWTHIVISNPSKLPFYRRLPPFKKAFEATAFPILAAWFGNSAVIVAPLLLSSALGLKLDEPWFGDDGKSPFRDPSGSAAWKSLVVLFVIISLTFFVAVPANILLVRIQSSLLPPDEETVVPFDRSFGGKLEPPVVGKGFITLRDALQTFPRSSWIRVYKLYAKVIAIGLALYMGLGFVVAAQAFLVFKAGVTKS